MADRGDQPPRLSGAAGRHAADRRRRHGASICSSISPTASSIRASGTRDDRRSPRSSAGRRADGDAAASAARVLGAISAPITAPSPGSSSSSCVVLVALFADVIAPHSPYLTNTAVFLKPPFWQEGGSLAYPLGTDAIGRDILSRLIYGARLSLADRHRRRGALDRRRHRARPGRRLLPRRHRDRHHAADGHHPDAAEPAARHRHRRDPRPGPDERDAGRRDRRAAALRAPRPRRGDHRDARRTTSPPPGSAAPARCG